MGNRIIRNSIIAAIGIASLTLMYSCASVGTPNGGPYDEDPPVFLGSSPSPNQTNYKGKRIQLSFDELIQLDKPAENVIITPPQLELPIIRATGRNIQIELRDSLKENTTYTIDFTNSISDNNEKNVLENFSIAFSTGDVVDSLEISGFLLNAENLEPMSGITIGLHNNLDDTAFVKVPFIRTSRTNDRGKFTIRNIAPGTYHIFGLNDINRDYKFDQPGEEIAFCDSLIVPTFEFTSRQDTLWVDSLTIDTIRTVPYTRFMPDDIMLRLFKEKFARQYMMRPERTEAHLVTLRFNAPLDTIPTLTPVNFTSTEESWYYPQFIEEKQAINYWLTDSMVWKQDSLQFAMTYPKSDSLNILVPQTDTVQTVFRKRPPAKQTKKEKEEAEKREAEIKFLAINTNATGSVNLFDTISVSFNEPITGLTKEVFSFEEKIDTLWYPVEFDLVPDTTNSLNYYLFHKFDYGKEYRIEIDSATIHNVYGLWNNFSSNVFKVKERTEYGHLYINITGVETTAFVELLNKSDAPVRKAKVKDGGALFMDLAPGTYYARLIEDVNDNGVWDTGNYAEKQQPESVYYSPKEYSVMQNWEVEESWNVKAVSLEKQKPLDITKNKPKEVTKQKRDHRNER